MLVSCDVAKVLVLKSSSKKDSSVIVYAQKSIIPFTSENVTEKIVIQTPTLDSLSQKKLILSNYGFGGWADGHVVEIAQTIDSIIIINDDKKVVLNNPIAVENYLLSNRKGIFNRILKIGPK